MSEFHVRIVRVTGIKPLPNSDFLDIVDAEGYPVIVKRGDYTEGCMAVYIPEGAVVPDTGQFYFLCPTTTVDEVTGTKAPSYPLGSVPEKYRRIKAKKLRGTFSMGLLVPVPLGDESKWHNRSVGDDLQAELGITRWDPEAEPAEVTDPGAKKLSHPKYGRLPWYKKPLHRVFWRRVWWRATHWGALPKPLRLPDPGFFPVFTDLEGLRKYSKVLVEGEPVVLTEKLHGKNFRVGWYEETFWVGSHNYFYRGPEKGERASEWWQVVIDHNLQYLPRLAPNIGWYGEVLGDQKGFSYGASKEKPQVRFFGAMDLKTRRYLDYDDFVALARRTGVATVPELYRGPWSNDLRGLAEGKSTISDHIREGFVVVPLHERWDQRVGRVALKMVGQGYLLLKGKNA